MPVTRRHFLYGAAATGVAFTARAAQDEGLISFPSGEHERLVEFTIESRKPYRDPFNEVEVDVVFQREGKTWRVPTFWRGGDKWTVRFAPPHPGEYEYRLESSDKANPDLNGHSGRVRVAPYRGNNVLLKHGSIRVSDNKRHFVHADGTPFYWLGDTWWTGLSDRLPWDGFQRLTQDRKAKGFTIVQICTGLLPGEEKAPGDPGSCNEGGCVWDAGFKQINPRYFHYADRRLQYLIDNGIVPALFGGWRSLLAKTGMEAMKRHWRNLIARYGAYPVVWVVGGEVFDPPPSQRLTGLVHQGNSYSFAEPGWTEVARYIRSTDPYRHPMSAHEIDPPFDSPLQDESLTDFDLFQAGHRSWPSIATEIALLNKHYARTSVIKPLVVGEIGNEKLTGDHHEDFQRAAFWLAMLNGAAGFTYGAFATAEAYSADKPPHRILLSPYTWEEGMNFPGAAQVAIAAGLLKSCEWWKLEPRPDWITPAGTTLLEPNNQVSGFDIDHVAALAQEHPPPDEDLPLGEWHERKGTWRLPYAAGIPRKLRIVYLPYARFLRANPVPTIKGLEAGVLYRVYYWEPTLGIKYDLGAIGRSKAGAAIVQVSNWDRELYDARGKYRGQLRGSGWDDYGTHQKVDGDAYHPEPPPTMGDWVLVMEAKD